MRPQRILIVRLSALGDTALTLPLAELLRQRLSPLRLGWLVGEQAAPLLRDIDAIDRLHVLPPAQRHPAGLWRMAEELRRESYELSLDPQGLSISALLPWLAGVPLRVGFAPGPLETRELAPLLINRRIAVPAGIRHIRDRTLQLSSVLGIENPQPTEFSLPVDAAAASRIDAWWRDRGLGPDTLVMGLGAGWPTKIWPADRAARLVPAATARGLRVVLLWGPRERAALSDWRRAFGNEAILAPATDIPGMLALLDRARAYAGADSAALHLAWLLGKPTFSWFGASDPARCAPYGPHQAHVAQGPHNWRRTALLGNPLGRLDPARVLPAFLAWLNETSHGA